MFSRAGIRSRIAVTVAAMALIFTAPATAQEGPVGEATQGGPSHLSVFAPTPDAALEPDLDQLPPRRLASTSFLEGPRSAPPVDFMLQPRETRAPQGLALVAAGAALVVTGSFIDNDAGTFVMVGGAAVIAWGVYRLVR